MNKKQILELVAGAIAYADQQDVDAERTRPMRAQGDARRFDRLALFAIAIGGDLETHAPGASALIKEFLDGVIYARNPLLEAADSNNEKPE